MGARNEDKGFREIVRDILTRLTRLESSENNKVKRNDIRLSDLVVTADAPNMRLCLENLNSHEIVCIGEQTASDPAQAEWSFSGDITSSNEGDSSPAFSVERNTTARQIVIAQPCNNAFSGTLKVCVAFCDGGPTLQVSLPGSSPYTVREINVPCAENDRIVCSIFDAGSTAANNVSVFVRFGTPTVAATIANECLA